MVTSRFAGGPRSSVDTNFQRSIRILLSGPPASCFFDAPSERTHCLARLTSRPQLKPSPRKASSFNSKKKERGRQGEVLRKQCKLSFRKSLLPLRAEKAKSEWVYFHARLCFLHQVSESWMGERYRWSHAKAPHLYPGPWLFSAVIKQLNRDEWQEFF